MFWLIINLETSSLSAVSTTWACGPGRFRDIQKTCKSRVFGNSRSCDFPRETFNNMMGHKGPPMAESDWDGSSGEVEREFTAMSLPNVSLPCHCPMWINHCVTAQHEFTLWLPNANLLCNSVLEIEYIKLVIKYIHVNNQLKPVM